MCLKYSVLYTRLLSTLCTHSQKRTSSQCDHFYAIIIYYVSQRRYAYLLLNSHITGWEKLTKIANKSCNFFDFCMNKRQSKGLFSANLFHLPVYTHFWNKYRWPWSSISKGDYCGWLVPLNFFTRRPKTLQFWLSLYCCSIFFVVLTYPF